MRTVLKFLSILSLLVFMFACSGSRKATEESGANFEDAQLQAKVEQLQKKIAKEPSNQVYRRQLATLYQENGNNQEALKILEKAFTFDPNNAETKYLYAEIAVKSGYKAKGYQAYKDILQGPEAETYLSRIAVKFMDAFKVTPIIDTPAQEAFGSFSADGNKIVYQSDVNGNWDIFEYDLTAQTQKQITHSPAHEEDPHFSTDGKKILYTSTAEDHRDVDYERKLRDIYVLDLAGNHALNLTTNGADDWHPNYSPDGKNIVFVSDRSDLRDVPFYQRLGSIFLMQNDGRFQMRLSDTLANDGGPCIAPGSTEDKGVIYFDSDRGGKKAIYRMDFKGKQVRQITFNPQADDAGPAISSSGDKIVFFSNRDGNYELYRMNSDGSAQQRLTFNPADDLNPSFSPDGNKIIFHSNRSGSYGIYIMDLTAQATQAPLSEVINHIDNAIKAAQ